MTAYRPADVESALTQMVPAGATFEIRIPAAGRSRVVRGYFDCPRKAAAAMAQYDGHVTGIYTTINPVDPDLIARACNRLEPYAKDCTADRDVLRRVNLLIDIDAKRKSGISSTGQELALALAKTDTVRLYLSETGWPEPLVISSGNGGHLLYAIDLPNDEECTRLVEQVLKALDFLFSDARAHVDTGVSNPARISKVPGTMVCKGDDTPERPHRRAYVISCPPQRQMVTKEQLQKVANLAPVKADHPAARNGDGKLLDLDRWIHACGLTVGKPITTGEWRGYELPVCPFNEEHNQGEARVLQRRDGALSAGCFHNSCDWGWHELRERYEPGYASKRERSTTDSRAELVAKKADATALEVAGPQPNLAALLDSIATFYRRYVYLVLPEHFTAVVLWVAHTWIFDQFETTPYIAFLSPEKRSGKSRNLDVLELVVAGPWPAITPSEAVLYRNIDAKKPTLLLDEIDTIFGSQAKLYEGVRAILNAGYRRGAMVPRCVGDGTNMGIRDFAVYCPKAFAGIGGLPDTVGDRSIVIGMRRRAPGESVEPLRRRDAQKQAAPLVDALQRWSLQTDLSDVRPEVPLELDDRAADYWEPLLAIADLAGQDWPKKARDAARVISAGRMEETASSGVRLLLDIHRQFETRAAKRIHTADLIAALVADEETPWGDDLTPTKLARKLKPYGIHPKQVRADSGSAKGYLLEDFADAWSRYLPALLPEMAIETKHPKQSHELPAKGSLLSPARGETSGSMRCPERLNVSDTETADLQVKSPDVSDVSLWSPMEGMEWAECETLASGVTI